METIQRFRGLSVGIARTGGFRFSRQGINLEFLVRSICSPEELLLALQIDRRALVVQVRGLVALSAWFHAKIIELARAERNRWPAKIAVGSK